MATTNEPIAEREMFPMLDGPPTGAGAPALSELEFYRRLRANESEMIIERKIYLGDSVYAEFDGYAVILTTDNGEGPSNTIVLEPVVLDALRRVWEKWHAAEGKV